MSAPARVLLIRLSAIGDVINVLPSLGALRRAVPSARIAFVVEDRAADLLIDHPMVDRVFVFPRRRWREQLMRPWSWPRLASEVATYVASLRAERFDVALDFQGNLKGGLHSLASGARRRLGFARSFSKEANHLFSTEQVVPPTDRPHRVEKFASLVQALGFEVGELSYSLPASAESEERIESFLRQHGLADQPLVAMHPGASARGEGKRWPAESYSALARRIGQELGARCVVTFGPGEAALAARVCAGGEGQAPPVVPAPAGSSLLDLAALLRRCRVLVSGDTGPMHLGAACGTTCVALFGPKDPSIYRPYGARHTVIYRPDRAGEPGMLQISVAEVFDAVARELRRTGYQPA